MTNRNATVPLSVVIATHNRSAALRRTLEALRTGALDRDEFEVIVVDNASTDATSEIARAHADRLIRLEENAGSCAKSDGVAVARGAIALFLDDDSYPIGRSLPRVLERFAADASLGAAGFQVHLPEDARECAALENVFVGCGVAFRTRALREVGGVDRSFFMQAEEYDLAFRLARAGWRVRTFDDLHVRHEKTQQCRQSDRTTYFDVRNNLRVVARHLPAPMHRIYRADVLARYGWLARRAGHEDAFRRGRRDGRLLAVQERRAFRATRLTFADADRFFAWRAIGDATRDVAQTGVRRVALADLGKNVFAFYDACVQAGLEMTAIGDDRFAVPQRRYRGVPIVPLAEALDTRCDAVIISNCAPVFAGDTGARVASQCCKPIFQWFGRLLAPERLSDGLASPLEATDKPNTASAVSPA